MNSAPALKSRFELSKRLTEAEAVAKTIPIIGIETSELRWIRMLVSLLRHPDPSMPELARQALLYLTAAAARPERAHAEPKNQAG